jgi:hypothetical protein
VPEYPRISTQDCSKSAKKTQKITNGITINTVAKSNKSKSAPTLTATSCKSTSAIKKANQEEHHEHPSPPSAANKTPINTSSPSKVVSKPVSSVT